MRLGGFTALIDKWTPSRTDITRVSGKFGEDRRFGNKIEFGTWS